MAQCYAESKPIGGTFDMHGGGYTGRLYCSGYGAGHLKQFQSYAKYTPPTTTNSSELIVPMFFKPKQSSRVPTDHKTAEVPKSSTASVNQEKPAPEIAASATTRVAGASESTEPDRMTSALAIYKAPASDDLTCSRPPIREGWRKSGNLSGELMPKKLDSLHAKHNPTVEFGGFHRSDGDGSNAASKSGSSSARSSGEITEMLESAGPGQSAKLGSASNGTGCSTSTTATSRPGVSKAAAASSHQSWPSSPANFRPSPRTRNLSEGSFSMIFPEEGHSRLYATSPSRGRLRDTSRAFDDKVGFKASHERPADKVPQQSLKTVGISDQKQSDGLFKGTTTTPTPTSTTFKRGELKEVGKARSCAGSPPRTHSRNVSDGNLGVGSINSLRGGPAISKSTSAPSKLLQVSTVEKTPAVPSIRPNATLKTASDGMNCGFVTGGSFTRSSAAVEKVSAEKLPELVTPSYGNITRGGSTNDSQRQSGKKSTTEAYGTGNVYLMGESMLLKKALTSKDAEEVKNIGNDQYKKGRFMEALSLYDRAISLSPGQAAYHSNRAAALAALGRLVEAVQECQHALLLDSKYSRAHQRLGTLLLRLGWVDEAKKHLQCVSPADASEIQRAESTAIHLTKCYEARKLRDWRTVIKESDASLVAGADSSVQVYALRAEALLRTGQLNEAEKVLVMAKRLGAKFVKQKNLVDERMLLTVQAEMELAHGRFDEALSAAEKATTNEPSNAEVTAFDKKVRRIVRARAIGNDLFKAGKYFEASAAYGEGLELDPENAVLFCNRAACRSKLRLWEKAIEDCNAALSVQPSYTKALLRRAQCYSQLERWENALRDYEALKSKLPGDVEVARALFEVQVAMKKSKGEEVLKFRFGGEIAEVYSPDQFKEAVTSPGLAVVHFITRWSERCKQITPFLDLLSKRYPSVNFVKVDIEDHPFLAKTECVGTVPTIKMYKNGLKVTEMLGPSQQKLENAVQHHIL